MYPSLSGKTALVTGGTRGIGAAITSRLMEEGCKVVITGTRERKESELECLQVDFLDSGSFERFLAELSGRNFDILVNNAGINRISKFTEIKDSDFEDIQQVNLFAPLKICKVVLPSMIKNGWGRIVNISSIFGVVSREYRASYSASKFGLDGLTKALAVESAEKGVLANCISPGFIDTELTRSILSQRDITEMISRVPIKRLGTPSEIASLVAFLASAENSFITGQNIVIDGGFTCV